jgi:spore germination protein YaaH
MKTALPSAILNADLVSQVSPFWYSLKNQNSIADLYTPANPSTPMCVALQSMQAAGFKIIPTITDGTNIDPKTGKSSSMVLSNLLADPTSRANVVNAILNLVVTNKFDGIDLDFENFAYVDPISTWSTTQPRWVQFLTDLATVLHAQGKILSITTPPLFDPSSGKKGYYLYAWSQVGNIIDQLHIMAYDYSTSSPGPIGPLVWTTSGVTYAASVIPASKIYIGVPGYGRDWVTKVIGTCPTLPINYAKTVTPGVVSTVVMHNVAALAATYGATPTYNQTFAESSFTYQKIYNGTTANGSLTTCTAYRTVWYQDAKSYTARANLVSRFHLGGLSEWTFGMEDPTAFQAIRVVALSIAPDSVSAGISADSLNPTFGSSVHVVATFALPDKTPAAGIPVHLQTQIAGGSWTTVQDGVTASDGTFAATLQPTQSTNVRAFTDGSWQRLEGDTPTLSISVSRLLSWSVAASMRAGVTYPITVQLLPAVEGVRVTLNNGSTVLTDATGKATFSVTNASTGFVRYQVSVAADPNFAALSSNLANVWVR